MRDDLPPPPWITDSSPTGPFASPRPNMRGHYLLPGARSAQVMKWIDRILCLLPKRSPELPELPVRFDRILLANWAHLGDVVTTQGAIRALRERHPDVKIGMIVASGGRAAIEHAGLVDRLHIVDHWRLNRAAMSPKEKRKHFRIGRARALKEIRSVGYQAAIDFYPFFPPAHPLFYRAGIPIRVGYTSGGFGPLLTHPVAWPNARLPIGEQYGALLNALHPHDHFPSGTLRPRRNPSTLAPLPKVIADARPYVVLHPGAGAPYKEWGMDHWRDLARRLLEEAPHRRIVVTGAGISEQAMAAEITALSPAIIGMAGKADWETFVSIVAHAEIVLCPDTATGHVAAAVNVPVVSIFTGTNLAEQWQPYTPDNRLLLQPVLCAPCNRPGCEVMGCIRPIQSNHVLAAMHDLGC